MDTIQAGLTGHVSPARIRGPSPNHPARLLLVTPRRIRLRKAAFPRRLPRIIWQHFRQGNFRNVLPREHRATSAWQMSLAIHFTTLLHRLLPVSTDKDP